MDRQNLKKASLEGQIFNEKQQEFNLNRTIRELKEQIAHVKRHREQTIRPLLDK
jgi:hypothetical protein